ncbi:Imm21 family immunity protein [Nonomuraea sp. NPDC049784]|uniref:Imm21 family immunity protein n=1 Tax=Nonomuraea sp. NPDC049784 TaxID=3154361 RepID=UPI0033E90F97
MRERGGLCRSGQSPRGGPLVLVAEKELNEWTGASGDDYELACAIDDLGVIQFSAGGQALVFWDEPARTTYFQRLRIFVQWIYADPGCDVEQAASELGDIAWEQGPTMDVSGPMVLLDAAAPGAEIQINQVRGAMDAEAISVEIASGRYRVDCGEIRPDERTYFRCYRLMAVA